MVRKDDEATPLPHDSISARSSSSSSSKCGGWFEGSSRRNVIFASFIFAFAGVLYYSYLDSLYIVDEYYNDRRIRELGIQEKTTIRVEAINFKDSKDKKANEESLTSRSLQSFVNHYSICQSVHDIQISFPSSLATEASALISRIRIPHTHSKITIDTHGYVSDPTSKDGAASGAHSNHPSSILSKLTIDTNSVFFLDIDVRVSCDDVAFALSVWSSGSDALVGFFPRIHKKVGGFESSIAAAAAAAAATTTTTTAQSRGKEDALKSAGKVSYELLPWHSSLFSRSYSIMLTSGVILKSMYLQELQQMNQLLTIVQRKVECRSLSLSMLLHSLKAPPPIYVHAKSLQVLPEFSPNHVVGSSSKHSGDTDSATVLKTKSECLTRIVKSLSIDHMKVSTHVAMNSKNFVFW